MKKAMLNTLGFVELVIGAIFLMNSASDIQIGFGLMFLCQGAGLMFINSLK